MADRPNFRRSPSSDSKKQSFASRVVTRMKELSTAKKSKMEEKAEACLTLRMSWLSVLRKRSHAPSRMNGEREMSRRRRQMANGTHGL